MGTDLILFVVEKDGKATCFHELGRDYDLYALLGYIKHGPHQEPYHRSRGLPQEIALGNLGRMYNIHNGDHNASWMTADEFELVKDRYEKWATHYDNEDDPPYEWPYDHIWNLATDTGGKIVFWFNS